MLTSTRTRRGFKAPAARRAPAPFTTPMFDVEGAEWAFSDSRVLVPAPAAAPVLALVPSLPSELAEAPVAPAPAPVAPAPVAPAPALSGRFRVLVVDLDSEELESVLVEASSAGAARRECSDEQGLPLAVWAVLPGGAESLVWGSAA